MKGRNPTAVGRLLGKPSSRAATLMARARVLDELTTAVRECLPEAVAEHCRVANVKDGTLVLATDSPAWSTRLRYLAPSILQKLSRNHELRLHRVTVRVLPEARPVERPLRRAAHMSAAGAAALRDTAGTIEDPDLRAALLRLARRGTPGG